MNGYARYLGNEFQTRKGALLRVLSRAATVPTAEGVVIAGAMHEQRQEALTANWRLTSSSKHKQAALHQTRHFFERLPLKRNEIFPLLNPNFFISVRDRRRQLCASSWRHIYRTDPDQLVQHISAMIEIRTGFVES